jgi:nuclease S1
MWWAALLLATSMTTPAWGWGCDGHRIVALIAWARLDEPARAAATDLLSRHPVPPEDRGCRAPSRNALADVAMWADAIRDDEPDTGPWHYVEVPRDARRSELNRNCRNGACVTRAIARQLDVLRSQASGEERARALRFLVHLVADVHQPLHVTGNGDKGGNCAPVTYLRDVPRTNGGDRWTPNLHGVWDVDLIATVLARTHATPSEYAETLRRRRADDVGRWQRAPIAIDDWAWETHEAGVDVAYGRLEPRPPFEHGGVRSCRDHGDVGGRMARLGMRIDDAYVAAAAPVVDTQLAKAGARLAAVLEAVLRP